MTKSIGRVVATERRPNTPHEFHFFTSIDSPVGIGAIVRVEADDRASPNGTFKPPVIYGIVTEGRAYTEPETYLEMADGVSWREVRVYSANVLRQIPDEPLQPVPFGEVYMADPEDVNKALRMDAFIRQARVTGARGLETDSGNNTPATDWSDNGPNTPNGPSSPNSLNDPAGRSAASSSTAIPIGIYRNGGMEAPIYLDADFLMGPEAAHLNITGMSGLATKTSAVEWILASLFAHFPESRGSIAAVCFNVKGPDLCFLDLPGELDEEDKRLYDLLGVPAEPFTQTKYFAPYNSKGLTLNTLRTNEALLHNVTPLTWGLREVLQFTEVLLTKDDVDAKADALIDFITENVVDTPFSDSHLSRTYTVSSFGELDAWFKDLLKGMEKANAQSWRTHHVATIRKVRNRLSNISTRCAGLVTDSGHMSDLPFGEFEDRGLYVVDVANLEEDAQDLVFARVVSKLREHLERRDLGVKHVIVFVDELNKYASSEGPETYVKKMLLDISERGRYLGLVLFSAQQFRSQVHKRVVGNSGTSFFGRMDADELTMPGYHVLSPSTKTKLASLEKGQLMVRHPHFTQPIFVKFPRPAVMRGRDGAEKYPQSVDITLEMAVYRDLSKLDTKLSYTAIVDSIAQQDEKEVIRARNLTLQERPGDVLAFFKGAMRRAVPLAEGKRPQVASLQSMPDDNPYGF